MLRRVCHTGDALPILQVRIACRGAMLSSGKSRLLYHPEKAMPVSERWPGQEVVCSILACPCRSIVRRSLVVRLVSFLWTRILSIGARLGSGMSTRKRHTETACLTHCAEVASLLCLRAGVRGAMLSSELRITIQSTEKACCVAECRTGQETLCSAPYLSS